MNTEKEILDEMFSQALRLAELASNPEEREMARLAWNHTLAIARWLGWGIHMGAIGRRCKVELVRKDNSVRYYEGSDCVREIVPTPADLHWLKEMQVSWAEPAATSSPVPGET